MKEYLTVNQYATQNGMSRQAVYKSISAGKIVTEEKMKDGKPIKCIVVDRDQEDATPPEQTDSGDNRQPAPKVVTAGKDEVSAFEKVIEALTQQLTEKDRQIAEKDRQIENLMQLLHNLQTLQAHNQMLLSQPEPETATNPEIIESPAEDKPKRRGFWSWLFE